MTLQTMFPELGPNQIKLLVRWIEENIIGSDEQLNAGNMRYVDDHNDLKAEQRQRLRKEIAQ